MPDPASIVFEMTLPSASRELEGYRILRTTEVDGYEPPVTREDVEEQSRGVAAPRSDTYAGTARKAAKLSIADAQEEVFADLRELIASLTPDQAMTRHTPRITTDAASDRVAEEKRNVRVRAFLYAASREDDNDFHLIIGSDPQQTPARCITMELSGLPPADTEAFPVLKAARDAYKAFFGEQLPGQSYDFYRPPIPVEIGGSLFFDMSHSHGQRPGPPSLQNLMATIWEVHPVTHIVFET